MKLVSRLSGGLSATIPDIVGWAFSVATYSGTVKGCPGPGTAVFRYAFKMGATPGIAEATPGHNYGTVEVVPGSGTGGLATLKGHGTDVADTTNGVVSNAVLDFSCRHGHG